MLREDMEGLSSFHLASKFPGEGDARQCLDRVSELFAQLREDHSRRTDLSAFPFRRNKAWHVVILGERPERYLEERLEKILSLGEPVTLPLRILEVLVHLRARRMREKVNEDYIDKLM